VILILGGTSEARELAAALTGLGARVTTSLAGRVANPRLPAGEVRVGGFGGPQGLAAWLSEHDVGAVVDATHPFAERISDSAATACEIANVPRLRLERPGWSARVGDNWYWVDNLDQAARTIKAMGTRRVFLTTGRQGLAAFVADQSAWFLIRCVDPPEPPLPSRHEVILDRGPYALAGELAVIDRHAIDVLVTKDSGGSLTVAKLDAARERSLPVIVVRRPARPPGRAVASVAEAVDWAHAGYRLGV
jgi:precorrin-6A/cobalt-precorrin-6A reductase